MSATVRIEDIVVNWPWRASSEITPSNYWSNDLWNSNTDYPSLQEPEDA